MIPHSTNDYIKCCFRVCGMLKVQYVHLGKTFNRKRDFFFTSKLKPNEQTLFVFHELINSIIINLTIKDISVSNSFTLFKCGGPCHLSSFKQCCGDLIFLREQLVYSVMGKNIFLRLYHYFINNVNIKKKKTLHFSPNLHSAPLDCIHSEINDSLRQRFLSKTIWPHHANIPNMHLQQVHANQSVSHWRNHYLLTDEAPSQAQVTLCQRM